MASFTKQRRTKARVSAVMVRLAGSSVQGSTGESRCSALPFVVHPQLNGAPVQLRAHNFSFANPQSNRCAPRGGAFYGGGIWVLAEGGWSEGSVGVI